MSIFLSPRVRLSLMAGPLARAVAASLRATPPQKQDAGVVALAKTYAALLDDAGALHAAAIVVVEEWDREDPIGRANVQKLADALAARNAVNDLGPKLLAALAALNMTPAARGREVKGVPARDPVADELAALRGRRGRGQGKPPPEDLHTAAT
jgi:hypothetical protein